jgi:hypothetical protein
MDAAIDSTILLFLILIQTAQAFTSICQDINQSPTRSDDFLRRFARVYELKYDMANLPVQDINRTDLLQRNRNQMKN